MGWKTMKNNKWKSQFFKRYMIASAIIAIVGIVGLIFSLPFGVREGVDMYNEHHYKTTKLAPPVLLEGKDISSIALKGYAHFNIMQSTEKEIKVTYNKIVEETMNVTTDVQNGNLTINVEPKQQDIENIRDWITRQSWIEVNLYIPTHVRLDASEITTGYGRYGCSFSYNIKFANVDDYINPNLPQDDYNSYQIEYLRDALYSCQETLQTTRDEIEELETERENVKSEYAAGNIDLDGLNSQVKTLEDKIAKKQAKVEYYNERVADLQNKLERLENGEQLPEPAA